jgi:hypothetical protein
MKKEGVQEASVAEEAVEEAAADLGLEEILDQEKCIKQPVLNVVKNVKYHLSQKKVEKFSAKNALRRRKDLTKFS